ncbi:MAG: hypothetical protein ACOCQX_00815 [Candidatus Nanoarchaeia archaeon]
MEPIKLKEASVHLFYEIDMLNMTAVKVNNAIRKKIFAKDKHNKEGVWSAQIELNLSIESFAIHARNLVEFFNGKVVKRKNYIRAEHYLNKENTQKFREIMDKNSALVKYIFDKANHQIAHLTFERIEPRFKGANKAWDLKKIDAFNSIIKSFLDLTSENILSDNLIKWKKFENPFQYYIRRYSES